jgi:hypothetical protein
VIAKKNIDRWQMYMRSRIDHHSTIMREVCSPHTSV